METNKDVLLSFESAKEVENFIKNTESGLYVGKNIDGEDVLVAISKGVSMEVKTLQSNNWWRINEYDAFGFCISESYSKA